jgi:hypothetical protein
MLLQSKGVERVEDREGKDEQRNRESGEERMSLLDMFPPQ